MPLQPSEEEIWRELTHDYEEPFTGDMEPVRLIMQNIPLTVSDLEEAILENKQRYGLDQEGVERALGFTAHIHSHPNPRSIIAELPLSSSGGDHIVDLIFPKGADADA